MKRNPKGQFIKGGGSLRKNGISINCLICKSTFYAVPSRLKIGKKKYCSQSCYYKSRQGVRISQQTEFKKGDNVGDKHFYWKGDEVGYYGLHTWVYRVKGKPLKCEFCETEKDRLVWANRSRKYKRDITDWLSLCWKCHMEYDSGKDRGAMKLIFNLQGAKI